MSLARDDTGRSRWSKRHGKSIHFVKRRKVDAAASYRASVPFAGVNHQFVSAASGIHHGTGVAIVTVQPLIARGANYPYNGIARAIVGGYPWRSLAALAHTPCVRDRRRITRIYFEGSQCAGTIAQDEICALACLVACSCLTSETRTGDAHGSYGCRYAAEIIAIK